ncbi:replication initiator protein A (plasmid) [Burkholderia thailandensis]|uniref:replication initiator protein A n=1 Tax=Burkholderia thailandensis TaxID=57975 RepID=UPI00192E05C5|nr:replication initiator protein A [Burkholderia thailandensis]MBS2132081.1 replication initiator protein A [Burkholderia thailandensis]QRA15194.1 replication initiator protein A [Burkholderia thailandensis]
MNDTQDAARAAKKSAPQKKNPARGRTVNEDQQAAAAAASANLRAVPDGPSSTDDGEQLELELDVFESERLPADWRPRQDLHSIEFPLWSLQKGKDTRTRVYRVSDKLVRIIPSTMGAANIFDKDILVYAATIIRKAADANLKTSRRIRFRVRDYLRYVNRSTGGRSYTAILDSCRRLRGTTVETNVDLELESGFEEIALAGESVPVDLAARKEGAGPDGEADRKVKERTRGFGFIEDYDVIEYTASGDGAVELEVILSRWTYNAIIKRRVLTMHPGYFGLGQPLERRLYDIAKKHCGDKLWWKIGLEKLHEKTGSAQELKYFRRDIVDMMMADRMPEFHVAIDDERAQVVFFRCDKENRKLDAGLAAQIHQELIAKKLTKWFFSLRRWDSRADPKTQLALIPD